MADEAQAFLRAIHDEPAEDAHRLVFADWLDEHGDEEWAGFIRDQVALARLDEADPSYPETLARMRRRGLLTRPPRSPMLDHVPGGKVRFRRGLIAGLQLPPDQYLRRSSSDWQVVPVEQLALVYRDKGGRKIGQNLAQRPELALLHTLRLDNHWPVGQLDPLLTDCQHLAGLRALRLGQDSWLETEDGPHLAALAPRLALPGLDSLHLHEPFDENAWHAMLDACRAPLRRLHLTTYTESRDWWTAPGFDWLQTTRHWTHLTEAAIWLNLNYTWSGSFSQSAALGQLPSMLAGNLEQLNLCDNELNRLIECENWGRLRSVFLTQHPFESSGFGWVAQARQAEQLSRLAVGPGFAAEDVDDFVHGPYLKNLRQLSLSGGPQEVLSGSFREQLLHLELRSMEDWSAASTTELPELRTLWIRWGYGGNCPLAPLAESRGLPNLCTLLFTDRDEISETELQKLAQAPGLPHLSLVGVGSFDFKKWWVLGDGKATRIRPDVLPLDEDCWQEDLLRYP